MFVRYAGIDELTIRYAGMLCTGIHAVTMTLSMTSSHYIHAHREQSDHFSDDEIHHMPSQGQSTHCEPILECSGYATCNNSLLCQSYSLH